MKTVLRCSLVLLSLALALPGPARADEVTDWNRHLFAAAAAAAPPTNPLVVTRVAAIVQASVFDAVNGIDRRYAPIHVAPAAPRGASRRAAVVQAAYASLVRLYPAQVSTLDAQREASLAAIADGWPDEAGKSVERGIEWGQAVADAIWAWRSGDGFAPPPPPFLGGNDAGEWRPTPPAFASGAGPQFAYMTPWVIPSPSAFRPGGPPALGSAQYATDLNETKEMGRLVSASRSADQTLAARFWAAGTASDLWNSVARSGAEANERPLVENARLFALLNLAGADAIIGCWEAKYHFVFWRPVTAITLADTDGNGDTEADTSWGPLLGTPAHPEYPSGHSSGSGAMATVLAAFFGQDVSFEVSNVAMPGVSRSFPGWAAALEEVANARIDAGIHFRAACEDGMALGNAVAEYVLGHALQPVHPGGEPYPGW